MSATYDVGEQEEPLLREDVDRLTPLTVLWFEFVGTLCSPAVFVLVEEVEDVALDRVRRLWPGCGFGWEVMVKVGVLDCGGDGLEAS